MKRFALLSILTIFVLGLTLTPLMATPHNEFSKAVDLSRYTGEGINEDGLVPGEGAADLPPQPPEAPVVDVPVSSPTTLYFCRIDTDKVGNLEAFCQKYGAKMRIYWNYRSMFLQKKAACLVEAPKSNTYLISQLKKRFHGLKMKKCQFKTRIWVYSALNGINAKREEFKVGSFEEMDAILAKIVKKPYGPSSKVFRILGKEFGDMVDSLSVVKKEHAGFGKKKRYLFNPTLDIELIGLNMRGKNKNVTLFSEKYVYRTVKRSQYYSWSK